MRFLFIFVIFVLSACPPKGGSTGLNQTSWPKVSQWSAGNSGKNDTAIIIAIEDYAFLPPVPGARESANDWENFFRKNKGMDDVFVLTDKNASIEEIHRFIDNAVAETKSRGSLWFVFVGHGAANPSGTDGLLIGMDANQSYESIKARSLSRNDLQARLSKGIQKDSVLILDACFSGRSTDGSALVKGAQPVIVTSNVMVPNNMTILSAAKGSEIAGPLPNGGRPAFSYLLLGGLRGWADTNDDANISSKELITFTQRQLRVIPGRQQTPTLNGAGDTILSVQAGEKDPGIQGIITGSANPTKKAVETTKFENALATRGEWTGETCSSQSQCKPQHGCIKNRCESLPKGKLKNISTDELSPRAFSFYGLNWNNPVEDWVQALGVPNYVVTENSRLHNYLYFAKLGRDKVTLLLEVRSGQVAKVYIDITEKFANPSTRKEVFSDVHGMIAKKLNKTEVQNNGEKSIAEWTLADRTSLGIFRNEGDIYLQFLNPQFFRITADRFLGKQAQTTPELGKKFFLGIAVGNSLDVLSVTEGRTGAKMGLRVGDQITHIDNQPVKTRYQLQEGLDASQGKEINITILRNGNKLIGRAKPISID